MFKAEGYQFAQIAYPEMDTSYFRKVGFKIEVGNTYMASIGENSEAILSSFSKSTRKHVRRAINRGLQVETTTDKGFIDIYYEQLRQVFAKRDMRPTYSKRKVEILWENLMPSRRLIATQVICEGAKIIATRLDFIAGNWMHSFGSASDQNYLHLNPNELARYHAMCVAAEKGARFYDMTGGGTYKAKFGGVQTEIPKAIYDPYRLQLFKSVAKSAIHLWFRISKKL